MPKYNVQFALIRRVTVTADNDLQAEREAFRRLRQRDKALAVAIGVNERDGAKDDPRTLPAASDFDKWTFAKNHFNTIDRKWLDTSY